MDGTGDRGFKVPLSLPSPDGEAWWPLWVVATLQTSPDTSAQANIPTVKALGYRMCLVMALGRNLFVIGYVCVCVCIMYPYLYTCILTHVYMYVKGFCCLVTKSCPFFATLWL